MIGSRAIPGGGISTFPSVAAYLVVEHHRMRPSIERTSWRNPSPSSSSSRKPNVIAHWCSDRDRPPSQAGHKKFTGRLDPRKYPSCIESEQISIYCPKECC